MKKTPIGIMPRKIWLEKRANEIRDAIKRYEDADIEFPKEWEYELNIIEYYLLIYNNKYGNN